MMTKLIFMLLSGSGLFLNMLPGFSACDEIYGYPGYSILLGYSASHPPALVPYIPNFDYILFCQYGQVASFASALPTFFNHILHIICLRPKEQVVRINANDIVTTMKNIHIRRVSMVYGVRYPVSHKSFLSNEELAVCRIPSVGSSCSGPLPAGVFVCDVDMFPKMAQLLSGEDWNGRM